MSEAARAVAPGGRLLVVDFAPHSLEFLREAHAHRRLGFSHRQMSQWVEGAGLTIEAASDLRPAGGSDEGLTVTIWVAQDRRVRMVAAGDPLEAGE